MNVFIFNRYYILLLLLLLLTLFLFIIINIAFIISSSSIIAIILFILFINNPITTGASMDKAHIASEMERFISGIEKEHGIARKDIAMHGVYFSHETSTHASATSSCAYNEV